MFYSFFSDFDLALRDERMLNNFGRVLSRKTRMALRNNLTKRHPAVPLAEPIMRALQQDGPKEKSSRSDCLDLGDFGEVKGIRMDVSLTKQMKIWQDELDERIKDHEKPPSYWDFPEREKGNIHKHCAYCLDLNCLRTYDAVDPEDDRACNVVECRWKCGATYHHCKILEHKVNDMALFWFLKHVDE